LKRDDRNLAWRPQERPKPLLAADWQIEDVRPMTTLAFLLDVDNTLLANDRIKQDFDAYIQVELGPALAKRFWDIYEQVRQERSVVDIPLALTRLREQVPQSEMDDHTYEHVRSIFDNYPFYKALYPHALSALRYLSTLGTTVIVSDGDMIFQAEKIVNSNLADAVDGRVLLYIHKQEHLDEVVKEYPADHYVMIDDKPQILVDSKAIMGDHLTTVFVEQGKYAQQKPEPFHPDLTVPHIGDLCTFTAEQFLSAAYASHI
jgi:FMN phosphatase YigB (HAD superfamily)